MACSKLSKPKKSLRTRLVSSLKKLRIELMLLWTNQQTILCRNRIMSPSTRQPKCSKRARGGQGTKLKVAPIKITLTLLSSTIQPPTETLTPLPLTPTRGETHLVFPSEAQAKKLMIQTGTKHFHPLLRRVASVIETSKAPKTTQTTQCQHFPPIWTRTVEAIWVHKAGSGK